MTYHYHTIECPHCHELLQRGCALDNCTTPSVFTEPFVSSDDYVARIRTCPETGRVYYVDYGDRPAQPAPAPACLRLPIGRQVYSQAGAGTGAQ